MPIPHYLPPEKRWRPAQPVTKYDVATSRDINRLRSEIVSLRLLVLVQFSFMAPILGLLIGRG